MFLSSEQALADTAAFIINIKRELGIPHTTKWVTFGGSYAGSLSAWLRMKYPHLVHAAVSSSGPLLAKIDFNGTLKQRLEINNKIITHNLHKNRIIQMTNELRIIIDLRSNTLKMRKIESREMFPQLRFRYFFSFDF